MNSVCNNKIEELSLMADGMLSMEKVKEIEKHLLVCPACNSYYKDVVAMKNSLQSFSLEKPVNLNELIGKAVRLQPKKKKKPLHIYRYATVAAACLVLAVFFIVKGSFNFTGDKSYETAELDNISNAKMAEDSSSGMTFTSDRASLQAPDGGEAALVPAPEADTTLSEGNKSEDLLYGSLSDFRYTTSAVEKADSLVVNPEGFPLDGGYGGMQDVFYASENYSLEEMFIIISKEYAVSEINFENENIYFIANTNMLPKLEARLGLVAAEMLLENKEILSIRIISVKTDNQ